MSNDKNNWQANFKVRCEAVGWTVEKSTSNHYKVKDRHGSILFTFPSTPSDKRALLNVIGDAKRAGLEDLEKKNKLRAERDRLQRIEDDRAANAAALERADQRSGDGAANAENLGDVDGVAIVSIAPAKFKTPIMPKSEPLADAEELLLADERIVYRCAKPAATPRAPELRGSCLRTFDSVGSLKSHISFHTRTKMSVTPRQRAKLEREEAERVKNSATSAVAEPAGVEPIVEPIVEPTGNELTVAQLTARLVDAADSVRGLLVSVENLAHDLSLVLNDIPKLHDVDPTIVEKAKRFDALRGMLQD